MTLKERIPVKEPEKKKDGWEVPDPNNPDCPFVGPYDTKAEANQCRIGLDRFYRKHFKTWRTL